MFLCRWFWFQDPSARKSLFAEARMLAWESDGGVPVEFAGCSCAELTVGWGLN